MRNLMLDIPNAMAAAAAEKAAPSSQSSTATENEASAGETAGDDGGDAGESAGDGEGDGGDGDAGAAVTEAEEGGEAGAEKPQEAAGEAQEEEPKGKPTSKSWEALFRKERGLTKREAELKARIAAHEQKVAQAEKLLTDFQQDPYGWAERGGLDYEQWTLRKLGQNAPAQGQQQQQQQPKNTMTREEVQAMMEQQRQQQQLEIQAQTWIAEKNTLLKTDGKYKAIVAWKAEDQVEELAGKYLREHKRWLTPQEASDMILTELEERLGELEKQGLISKSETAPAPKTDAPKPSSKTASQAKAGQPQKPVSKNAAAPPPRRVSREEEIQRLAPMLRWRS